MNILIAGITGFIGKNLATSLKDKHTIYGLGRNKNKSSVETKKFFEWDENLKKNCAENKIDVIINLCGSTIGKNWSESYKKKIRSSRIDTTATLSKITKDLPNIHLINASGIHVYGTTQVISEPECIEKYPAQTPNSYDDKGFLCKMARDWEASANTPKTTWLRLPPVFDYSFGIYQKLTTGKNFGFLIQLGSGQIPFPWIALVDLVRAIDLIIDKKIYGPLNMCVPEILSLEQIIQMISAQKRLYRFQSPNFLVSLMMQEMGNELLLSGCNTPPKTLIKLKFDFYYPDIKSFLHNAP